MKHLPPTSGELLASLPAALPTAPEAEEAILCACLTADAIQRMRRELQTEAFASVANQWLFDALCCMDAEGLPIDYSTATNWLRQHGKLEGIGGPFRISELAGLFLLPGSVQHHLQTVKDVWTQRRAIHGHLLALRELYGHGEESPSVPIHSTVNKCAQIVAAAVEGQIVDTGTSLDLIGCLDEHFDYMQALMERKTAGADVLLPTGFPTLDKSAGGIGKDEYWLITGPTKGGKTVLATNIAAHSARRGHRTKYYSAEVKRLTLAGRLIWGTAAARDSMLDGSIDRRGLQDRREMDQYMQAARELKDSIGRNLIIDNAAGKYCEDLISDMRIEADLGTKLFVVDLIGKLRTRSKFELREREIASMSYAIYEAGKRLDVAVIVIAQENDNGQIRESRSLGMDCEAHFRIAMVPTKKKTTSGIFQSRDEQPKMDDFDRSRRNIECCLARGFGSGDVIPCYFDGPRFILRELSNSD